MLQLASGECGPHGGPRAPDDCMTVQLTCCYWGNRCQVAQGKDPASQGMQQGMAQQAAQAQMQLQPCTSRPTAHVPGSPISVDCSAMLVSLD